MWRCINCDEDVDNELACCWNCGADESGTPDPTFVHADDVKPQDYDSLTPVALRPNESDGVASNLDAPRFGLRHLLIITTVLCVMVGVLRDRVGISFYLLCLIAFVPVFLGVYMLFRGQRFGWWWDKAS